MADQQKVRWDETKLPKNPRRWSTSSGDKPLPSPFPHADPWGLKFVLSFDGGGIRGYSSLLILQALMEEVGKIEQAHNPKATSSIYSSAVGPLDNASCAAPTHDAMAVSGYRPCHYFDYIAGVGTGGIIAMMLGRYRMSVDEAMERYWDVCPTAVERQILCRKSVLSRTHKASRWLPALTMKLIPAWKSPNEDAGHLHSDPRRCCTIVCGCGSGPLRSDAVCSPPSLVDDIISQFLGAEPSREPRFYNNPSRTVLKEVCSLPNASQPNASQPHHKLPGNNDICLLSIGSAINGSVDPRFDRLQYQMICQIQRVHQELSPEAQCFDLDHYCRLDVPGDDLQDIRVNEWKTIDADHLRRIEEATNIYLQTQETATQLHDFAERLVEKRELRAETLQWERWALGVFYRCPKLNCEDWNERFDDSAGFWAHMLNVHGVKRADYDEATERRYEEYEAMGRTREKPVDGEINYRDLLERGSAWEDFQKKIAAAKEERGRDLRTLAEKAEARREVEDWIGA